MKIDWKTVSLETLQRDETLQKEFYKVYTAKFNIDTEEIQLGCNSCIKKYFHKYMDALELPDLQFRISKAYRGLPLSSTIHGVNPKGSAIMLSEATATNELCQVYYDYHMAVKRGTPVFMIVPPSSEMAKIRKRKAYTELLKELGLKKVKAEEKPEGEEGGENAKD